jgi:PKD repeat protein
MRADPGGKNRRLGKEKKMKYAKKIFYQGLRIALLVSLFSFGTFGFLDQQTASAQADLGSIAYVKRSTDDIHVISPDGTGDRVLWTIPQPFVYPANDLAWRPDGRELAFSSEHEEACSWYQSDIYAIGYDGTGYRRITNSPACAALASLPKGSVTVDVANYTSSLVWVYVQGAPEIKSILGSGTVTFDNVADFGPGVLQPSIGIWGLYRLTSYPPYADVQPGQTVPGGNLTIMQYSGFSGFGAGKVSWKADGSALAYGMRSASGISQIPANPSYGSIGVNLPVVEYASPSLVAWGPTPATKDQYLYSSGMNIFKENVGGIYLNTVGDASGGTQLVLNYDFGGEYIHDIEWLPDGSGFLFSMRWVPLDICSDIFEYNFATQSLTQLTPTLRDESGDGGARELGISPDGQQIVFERAVYPNDPTSSLWIMNRDGSGLHKLADDAGRPAWGPSYVPQPAHAGFVGTPASGVRPLLVQFTNQSTGDYDTCTWTFGDGSTSTSCGNPTHSYTTKGVYTAALTVTGPQGTDTRTHAGSITVYEPVQADFAGSPTAGIPPLVVTFTNQSTGDYDTCAWTFGDGKTSNSCANSTHTYATEGAYTVALTVSGLGGADTQTRDRYLAVQDEYRVYLPLALGVH